MSTDPRLAVLSDAFEAATGEPVDLTAWALDDLLRVLRNPEAVFALLDAHGFGGPFDPPHGDPHPLPRGASVPGSV